MGLYIGLMSGTSMDGIDAALVDLPSNQLIAGLTKKYSPYLKKQINQLVENKNVDLASMCQVNTLIGREFAEAAIALLHKTKTSSHDVVAIGSHGQTICHNTLTNIPYTLQLGCGHTISSLTGITVVADFRTRDLVHGGQGAPFAPLYHQELFAMKDQSIAVVNIGGIANVTFISDNSNTEGWDVGPGNCLMDAWIYQHQKKEYDGEGAWAQQGKIIEPLLHSLLADSFFSLSTPKSIGKEYFSLTWLDNFLKKEYQPVDVQATLLALTAHSLVNTILKKRNVRQLFLCGGGAHNQQLKKQLEQLMPVVCVESSAHIGIDPDYLEAMMFAWLANQTINQIPVHLSSITGSLGVNFLGAVYPKQSGIAA
jgi:anhydro-N-acetylmuramic acid kinase